MIKMTKRYIYLLFLVLTGCSISFFLAEGVVRVFYPHSRDHVIPGGLFDIDGHLGWKFKPEKSGTHHSRYFDVVYTINSLGYRDEPRRIEKDENIYRILLYGDSQIFGWGIPENERFSNVIENQQRDLEIWNLAVLGYGLDQEILSYEKDGKFLNADEVILWVSMATLGRIHTNYIYKKYKPRFEIDQHGSLRLVAIPHGKTSVTDLLYDILSPLYLPYFMELRLKMLEEVFKEARNRDYKTHTKNRSSYGHTGDLEKRMLLLARDLAMERKHKITILLNLPKVLRKEWQDFCAQNGIGFLAITLDSEKDDFIFGPYDRHWNPHAHKRIAEQLVSHLERNGNR